LNVVVGRSHRLARLDNAALLILSHELNETTGRERNHSTYVAGKIAPRHWHTAETEELKHPIVLPHALTFLAL